MFIDVLTQERFVRFTQTKNCWLQGTHPVSLSTPIPEQTLNQWGGFFDLPKKKKGVAAKKLAEHLEFEIFFGDTRVLVESFGEEKLMLGFLSRFSVKIP